MNKVLLTVLGDPMVGNSFNGILHIFVIWKDFKVAEMLRIIVVVLEHVWGEDWVSGVSSWNVESKVAMLIDIRDLVRSSPDCPKGDIFVPSLLCTLELFIACSDEVIAENIVSKIKHFEVVVNSI